MASLPQVHAPPMIVYTSKEGHKEIFIRHEELGHGGFAYVYRVTQQGTNKEYALKVISKQFLNSKGKETFEKLRNEMKIQRNLNHPNIVHSKLAFSDELNYYIVLEYCPGKSIREYLKKSEHGYLSEPETRKILRDVVRGLIYLHSKNIVHHDIKLENFIIGANGKVKIADFGLSTILKDDDQKKFSICGTTSYLSPEVLNKEGHDFKVDIWAIGVAAFIMLTGQPPFGNTKKEIIFQRIKSCDYFFPSAIELSAEAKSFIKCILQINPEKRPTAIELSNHPFLTKFDTELIDFYRPNISPQKVLSSAPIHLYGNNNVNINNINVNNILNLKPTDSFPIDSHYILQNSQKARSPTPSQISQKPILPIAAQTTQKARSPTPSHISQKSIMHSPMQASQKARSPTPSQSSQKSITHSPMQTSQKVRSPTPSQSSQKVRSPTPLHATSKKMRSPTPNQSFRRRASDQQDALYNSPNSSRKLQSSSSRKNLSATKIRSSSVSSPRKSKNMNSSEITNNNNNSSSTNAKSESNRHNSSASHKNSQIGALSLTGKKNFVIPNYFVTKFCLHGEDIGYLLGNGTVGVCFKETSRIVIDPNETFLQYYSNYDSSFETINILNYTKKKKANEKLLAKISLALRFAKSLKKAKSSQPFLIEDADPTVPLYHVKYFFTENDSFLFKFTDKNIQVNFSDHTKMIIFWNTKKLCLVRAINEKCCLVDLNDVANMNSNCDLRQKFRNAKLMLSDLGKKIQIYLKNT